ncbi:MAG: MFS transporter [Burkholderiales bacterium]|nr:MFS transporter [Burkholderiales bacterium]
MTPPQPPAGAAALRPLGAFYFWYFAWLGLWGPYFTLYLKAQGLAAFEIAVLVAIVPVTRMVGPTLWGAVADARGRRIGIVRLTATGASIAFAGVFASASFTWLFAVLLVTNAFSCGLLPLVEATTMGHLTGVSHRYGRVRAWGSVGFVIAVLAGGALVERAGVDRLLPAMAVLLALHAVAAWRIVEAPPAAHAVDATPLGEVLRSRPVVALFAACALMSVAHGPFHTFYSIWMVEHGWSKDGVGLLWALGVVCEIGVFLVWRRLAARFALRTLLLFAFVTAGVRFVLTGAMPHVAVVVVACAASHGITFGVFHAAAVALVHRHFAGRLQARGQALYSSIGFGFGGAVGGLLAGAVWDAAGGATAFAIGGAAGFAAAIVAATGLPRRDADAPRAAVVVDGSTDSRSPKTP